jgi:hypothetical protein
MDEAYWCALLEQGEHAPETVPPSDPQEVFYALGLEPGPVVPGIWAMTETLTGPKAEEMWQLPAKRWSAVILFTFEPLVPIGATVGGLEWFAGVGPARTWRDASPSDPTSGTELASRIGDAMTVRLIEVDPHQNQLVFLNAQPYITTGRLRIALNAPTRCVCQHRHDRDHVWRPSTWEVPKGWFTSQNWAERRDIQETCRPGRR